MEEKWKIIIVVSMAIALAVALYVATNNFETSSDQITNFVEKNIIEPRKIEEMGQVILTGIPISAEAKYPELLAIVIQTEDGAYIYCKSALDRSFDNINWSKQNIMKALTIIKSEINDGDCEPIILKGQFEGDQFDFVVVIANGITVDATYGTC